LPENVQLTSPADQSADPLGPPRPPRRRALKLLLLLASVAFSGIAFLALDWFHTAYLQRVAVNYSPCRAPDPIRHHAFKPNCAGRHLWGGKSYDFFTNSLGFRDEKVREVPLTDARPRILLLGDSFTEGKLAWPESYVAMIARHFPQYDFLNAGVSAYSPSNYLNTARMVLKGGYQIDEVMVFIDMSDVQDEAAFYRDIDASGAVDGPARQLWNRSGYMKYRFFISKHLSLTDSIVSFFERLLAERGYYDAVNASDVEWAAWTYRKVDETDPSPAGFAPLGVEGGIAKEKAKMTLLWQELNERNIPISVVVYPYAGQIIYDSADSRQVRIWREWCEGKCKRFISLFPAFLAAKEQCPLSRRGCWYAKLFIFGDIHYNAGGNALVADAVIHSLTAEPVVKLPEPGPLPSAPTEAVAH
jgi:hypothetical protein